MFVDVFTATGNIAAAAFNLTTFIQPATWQVIDTSCTCEGSTTDNSFAVNGGLGRKDVVLDYDQALYSYVGCRCTSGYDNVYLLDASGGSQQLSVLLYSTCVLCWGCCCAAFSFASAY